jgi:hypothetical protein
LAHTEGILTGPVYTGRALGAMLRDRPSGDCCLLAHRRRCGAARLRRGFRRKLPKLTLALHGAALSHARICDTLTCSPQMRMRRVGGA